MNRAETCLTWVCLSIWGIGMHSKKYLRKARIMGSIFLIFCIISPAYAEDIIETVGGLNNLLYGIAAGLAALMITLHAIRWKTADNPSDREEAKRGIINVILALILIMITAAVISVIYVTPPVTEPSTTTRIPTTMAPPTTHTTTTTLATTTTTTTTTSTTTTTISATLLTADNLANCINATGGMLYTNPPNCVHCRDEANLWANETAPVGPGAAALASIPQSSNWTNPCGGMPCWTTQSSQSGGCLDFPTLNQLYGCGLTNVTNHTYLTC